MSDFAVHRENMVQRQLRTTRVNDKAVVRALRRVPRELFVPAERQFMAYIDEDVPIAPGRWLMEPMVFGRLMNTAQVLPDERALVVGAGSGYSAAVLAQLGASVTALEADAGLVAMAEAALKASGHSVSLHCAPADAGFRKNAPYDVIFIDGAVEYIPDALIDQLANGGRLIGVLIEDGVGRGIEGRKAGGAFGTSAFMDAQVPALPGFERPHAFQF